MNLRLKFALTFAATMATLFGFAALALTLLLEADFKETLARQHFILARELAREIDEKVAMHQQLLVNVSHGIDASHLARPESLQSYLATRTAIHPLFHSLFVLSPQGRVLADFPQLSGRLGADLSDRAYFNQVMTSSRIVVSEPLQGRFTHEPVLVLAAPVLNERGRILAILCGVLELKRTTFIGELAQRKIGEGGYFYLISPQRRLISHPNSERLLQVVAAGSNRALDQAMAGFEGSVDGVNSQGLAGLFAFKRMEHTGWILSAVLPRQQAYAALDELKLREAWLLALALALALPLGWLCGLWLHRPLLQLTQAVGQLGLAGAAEQLPVSSHDEIGSLALAFNRLLGRIQSQQAVLEDSERNWRAILARLGYGVYVTDEHGNLQFLNPAAEKMLGVGQDEARGLNAHGLFHYRRNDGSPYPEAECPIVQSYREGLAVPPTREYFIHRNGSMFPVELMANPLLSNGRVTGAVTIFQDIGLQLRQEAQLQQLAQLDPLTRLPNRRLLGDRALQALKSARRTGDMVGFLFIDLDRFKPINDRFGHATGDALLVTVADRLVESVREEDTVARIGGDEFVVLLQRIRSRADAERVVAKIREHVQREALVLAHRVTPSLSIGIACAPEDGEDLASLFDHADQAMYQNKQSRR